MTCKQWALRGHSPVVFVAHASQKHTPAHVEARQERDSGHKQQRVAQLRQRDVAKEEQHVQHDEDTASKQEGKTPHQVPRGEVVVQHGRSPVAGFRPVHHQPVVHVGLLLLLFLLFLTFAPVLCLLCQRHRLCPRSHRCRRCVRVRDAGAQQEMQGGAASAAAPPAQAVMGRSGGGGANYAVTRGRVPQRKLRKLKLSDYHLGPLTSRTLRDDTAAAAAAAATALESKPRKHHHYRQVVATTLVPAAPVASPLERAAPELTTVPDAGVRGTSGVVVAVAEDQLGLAEARSVERRMRITAAAVVLGLALVTLVLVTLVVINGSSGSAVVGTAGGRSAGGNNTLYAEKYFAKHRWWEPFVLLGAAPDPGDSPPPARTACRNTVQGVDLLTDDQGRVCSRDKLDPVAPGCCLGSAHTNISRYSCQDCVLSSHCCHLYEICVSCCLSPEMTGVVELYAASKKDDDTSRKEGAGVTLATAVAGADRFLLCTAVCRTSSESVKHQTQYKNSHRKHCFAHPSS
eukprot:TRINITY_DN2286_c0_g1_i10.p2 TRINITY_DN2286_c0_g1~~TRINITY_DN2286_c0_g1_i10.p2  ORF type:complete len:516 (-),score=118.19 TRINITY_DN2286_c0_g1_i10:337-1884(-)